MMVRWLAGIGGLAMTALSHPGEQLVAVVPDVAAELHVWRAGAALPPVRERPRRQAEQVRDLTLREEHWRRRHGSIYAMPVGPAIPYEIR